MHYRSDPFMTTQVNGLVTPLTQPSSGDSCYNETFTPLEEMQLQYPDNTYPFSQRASYNACWLPQDNHARQSPADQRPLYRGTHFLEQQLPFTYLSAPDIYTGTAPPTPDFFPTTNYAVGDEEKPQITKGPDDEVLVGMGLYDVPSPPISTGLLGSHIMLPHRGPHGKGLKLEETFQPSIAEDSDDKDANNEESQDNQEKGFAHSAPTGQENQLQEPEPNPEHTRLADQSFFFDNDPEDDALLQQPHDQHFSAPTWTEVSSGTPFKWI